MELCLGNKLGILHVHQILRVQALCCKFTVAEYADLPFPVRQVLQADPPDFMGRAHGNVIQCPAADAVIFTDEFRIAGAVVAFSLILFQRLAHGVPAGRPEVSCFLIPQVDIPAGLVKLIEGIAQDSSRGAALDKAVASGVHRYDGTVIR